MKELFIAIVSICLFVRISSATDRSAGAQGANPVKSVESSSWQTAPPPHIFAVADQNVEFHGAIKVTTDGFGKVTKAVIVKRTLADLDRKTVAFALSYWKGPPNSSRVVPIVYKIAGPGWQTPRGPYPSKALAAGVQGRGVFRISTNRNGRVEKVEIIQKIHPLLDEHTMAFARAHWTGPPNVTRNVPVRYQIK